MNAQRHTKETVMALHWVGGHIQKHRLEVVQNLYKYKCNRDYTHTQKTQTHTHKCLHTIHIQKHTHKHSQTHTYTKRFSRELVKLAKGLRLGTGIVKSQGLAVLITQV